MRRGEAGRQVTASGEESLDRHAKRRVDGGEGVRRRADEGRSPGEVGPGGRRLRVGVASFGGVVVWVDVGLGAGLDVGQRWVVPHPTDTGMDVVGADASVFEKAVERRVDADGSGEGEAKDENADEAAAKGRTDAPERREASSRSRVRAGADHQGVQRFAFPSGCRLRRAAARRGAGDRPGARAEYDGAMGITGSSGRKLAVRHGFEP